MKIAVILPAAGRSTRFAAEPDPVLSPGEGAGRARSKVEFPLSGKPAFLHALERFLGRPEVGAIVVAVHPAGVDDFRLRWDEQLGFHGVKIVAGGTRERWETVLLALEAAPAGCTHIAIHDAARPLVSDALIGRVFAAARSHPAVIPALPVTSTLKRVGREEASPVTPADPLDALLADADASPLAVRPVIETVDRRDLVEVQTPQVFDAALLRRAYAALSAGEVDPAGLTDDAGLIEALGERVVMVAGESTNFKITYPADAELAAALLERRAAATATQRAARRLFNDDDDD